MDVKNYYLPISDGGWRDVLVRDHDGYPNLVVELGSGKLYVKEPWPIEGRIQRARKACGCDACVIRDPNSKEVLIAKPEAQRCEMAAAVFSKLPEFTLKAYVRHMKEADTLPRPGEP